MAGNMEESGTLERFVKRRFQFSDHFTVLTKLCFPPWRLLATLTEMVGFGGHVPIVDLYVA